MIEKPKANENGWVKTDDLQYVKQINETTFRIYDEIRYGEEEKYVDIFYGKIDVSDYSDEELEKEVESYYPGGLIEVKETYGNDWMQIVAEIIAEQSDHDYTPSTILKV